MADDPVPRDAPIVTTRRSSIGSSLLLVPLAIICLAVALALGGVLHLTLRAGFYFVIIVPVLLAFGVACAVYGTLALSGSRSRAAGLLLGFLAGVVFYLGQFYVGLVLAGGPRALTRLDLLPRYIAACERSQTVESVPGSHSDLPHGGFDTFMNWLLFAFELGLSATVTTIAGEAGTSRARCELCRRRLARKLALLPAGSGEGVVSELEAGRLDTFAALAPVVLAPGRTSRYTAVALETCHEDACPAYVSVKEVRFGGGAFDLARYEGSFGRTLLRQREISPEERARFQSWRAFGGPGAPAS